MSEERNVRDETRIERLIGNAYNRLPEPEPSRLNAVEECLMRALPRRETKRGTVGWYWWLIAALAASAAATWWAGGYLSGGSQKEEIVPQAPTQLDEPRRESLPEPARETGEKSSNVESPTRTNERPLIYRRERY